MNIAIFSGEVSGDLIGGALAQELRKLAPDVELWGLGSGAMREAGVELLADSAEWGAISITEAIVKVPGLLARIAPKVKNALRTRRPDVVVLVDFGAFNVRAARFSKSLGLKVCYYFPPGNWRRNATKGADLVPNVDLFATPFPWSEEHLKRLGGNAVTVGHPILERVQATLSREQFAGEFGMDASKPIIGLLPGSRRHEVSHLMPTLLDAARLVYQRVPDAQFVVGVAASISPDMMAGYLQGHAELRDRIGDIWHEFVEEAETKVIKPVTRTARTLAQPRRQGLVTVGGIVVSPDSLDEEIEARKRSQTIRAHAERALPPTVLAKGMTYEVMAHSDVLLTCSGTATLEAAVFGTPMVILYRGSKVMEIEYKLRGLDKKILNIGLPNIIADKRIVPELIQSQATPEAIAEHALQMMNDIETRQRVKADLRAVRDSLGSPGASARTARLVLDLASHP